MILLIFDGVATALEQCYCDDAQDQCCKSYELPHIHLRERQAHPRLTFGAECTHFTGLRQGCFAGNLGWPSQAGLRHSQRSRGIYLNFSVERLEHCHYLTRAGRKQARRLESWLKRFLHCAMLRMTPVEMTIVRREKGCGKMPDPSIISSRIGSQRLADSV